MRASLLALEARFDFRRYPAASPKETAVERNPVNLHRPGPTVHRTTAVRHQRRTLGRGGLRRGLGAGLN
jgi:hypothetical protein